jgi:hypothetical protein
MEFGGGFGIVLLQTLKDLQAFLGVHPLGGLRCCIKFGKTRSHILAN